nr:CAP domain-containing protein [Pseudomonas helmanticensis]
MCGRQRFAAARPLSWNPALGAAAQGHSKAMAYGNYFAHRDPDGDLPADRARAAGYRGRQVGENIAADRARRAWRWRVGWPAQGTAPI